MTDVIDVGESIALPSGQAQASASVHILCKNVMDVLNKHYPGHLWVVGVDDEGGVVNFFNTRLSGSYGMTLKISTLKNHSTLKKEVTRLAGELLERYGLPRGRLTPNTVADIKRSHEGSAVHL